MLIAPEVSKKRGVDKELSRWGVDKADGEGWAAFGNATPETKALLESFGFYVAEHHEFQGGLVTNHRLRAASPQPLGFIDDAQPVEQYVSPVDIFLSCHAY